MGRRGEVILRDLIREAIGLEEMLYEWGVLDEDPSIMSEDAYSRKIDRVVQTDIKPNITSLKLKALERPTAAKADIDNALDKADGSYEKAVKYLPRDSDETVMNPRSLRRLDYELKGGARQALKYKEEFASEESDDEQREKKEKMKGLKKAHKGEKANDKY